MNEGTIEKTKSARNDVKDGEVIENGAELGAIKEVRG